ncbi:hypothetical protein CO671_25880 [Rhizobium sp. M10]|nr:hypothetical protein CO671_25880 [Rhizobium sp. M10]
MRQRPNGLHFPFIDTEEFPTADGVVRYARIKVGARCGNSAQLSENANEELRWLADKSVSTQAMELDDRKTTT